MNFRLCVFCSLTNLQHISIVMLTFINVINRKPSRTCGHCWCCIEASVGLWIIQVTHIFHSIVCGLCSSSDTSIVYISERGSPFTHIVTS